jgi:sugar/nucleoside kinase (ribokinase family)
MEAICIGMAVVDVLAQGVIEVPRGGSTAFVERLGMSAGGDAVNQAITLSRLGHDVGLMSLVGDDPQGTFLLQQCVRAGVDTRGVRVSHNLPTSTTIVLVGQDGERSCLSQRGGTADGYGLADVDLDLITTGVKVVSVGSLLCSERLDKEAVPEVLEAARNVGATTIADFVPNRPDVTAADLAGLFGMLDYVAPSMAEAAQLTGKDDPDEAVDVLLGLGARNVVLKLGARGALARSRAVSLTVPAFGTDVVDTTGAGDNFMAGFISGILHGRSLRSCLELASATAALSVRVLGATGGVRDAAQVDSFLESHR